MLSYGPYFDVHVFTVLDAFPQEPNVERFWLHASIAHVFTVLDAFPQEPNVERFWLHASMAHDPTFFLSYGTHSCTSQVSSEWDPARLCVWLYAYHANLVPGFLAPFIVFGSSVERFRSTPRIGSAGVCGIIRVNSRGAGMSPVGVGFPYGGDIAMDPPVAPAKPRVHALETSSPT